MTVSNTITDMKLKRLIIACNETKNYRKVAVVGFTLMSNIIDEISLKLGMRPREKKKESLLTYIYMVNEVYEKNLQIQIFQEGIIQTVKEIELLFLRNKGDLPPEYVKKIIEVYYELRKVKVPNVYRSPTGDGYFDNTNLHMLSTGLRTSKKNTSKFKPILLQKIREQERTLQGKLNSHLNQEDLEKAFLLRNMKQSLDKDKGLSMQGILKDSLDYRQNYSIIIKFVLIGVALLSLFLGIIIIGEIFLYPLTIPALSNLLLIFIIVCVVMILLYRYLFQRR